MKMTELFALGYAEKAREDSIQKFTQRCRRCGDRMSWLALNEEGVSSLELKEELNSGMIKNEVDCGSTRRCSGYSLTAKGIKEVYRLMKTL